MYLDEITSPAAQQILSQDLGLFLTSELSRVEMRSMLARYQRQGVLNHQQISTIFHDMEHDLPRTGRCLPLNTQVVMMALELFSQYPEAYLKSLDALHIATAHAFGIQHLVTNDKKQADFAALTGLEVTLLSDVLLM